MEAKAPYNFISFPNKPLTRYCSEAEIPGHDSVDSDLLSGEIRLSVKAETPILVSNGNGEFVRNADGTVVLPGSTMKGMTRANMQILGFGRIDPDRDIADRQIFYRTVGAPSQDKLNEYYRSVVQAKQKNVGNGTTVTVPESVKAGYLHHEGNHYYIIPSRTLPNGKNYLPLPLDYHGVSDLVPHFASSAHVNYDGTCYGVKMYAYADNSPLPEGWLLKTGKYVGKKNKCYLIPEPDTDAVALDVPDKDILSYKADYEAKRNSLGVFGFEAAYQYKNASAAEKDAVKNYWDLPENGCTKPMFYAEYDGHVYLGISLFLRIGYQYPLSHGIPDGHKETFGNAVDYPDAILGFAGKDSAYKSRVSFSDFSLKGSPIFLPSKIVSGEPKPSFYAGYVKDGKHYNEEDFQLRGYKRYWHKKPDPKSVGDNVSSEIKLLKDGAVFTGVVKFHHLYSDELGLLLWSLTGDSDSHMSLGRGKPFGYGQVKISIDSLNMMDLNASYSLTGFLPKPTFSTADPASYIERYIAKAESMLPQSKKKVAFRNRPQIQDFLYLLRTIMPNEKVRYMDLDKKEFKNAAPMPTIADYRKDTQKKGDSSALPASNNDWSALLSLKFNTKK